MIESNKELEQIKSEMEEIRKMLGEIKENTAYFKGFMEKYNIPVENVLRHYDVTGKVCPEPWVRDEGKWSELKSILEGNEVNEVMYNTIDEVPSWAKSAVQKLIDNGKFAVVDKLDLSDDMVRIIVLLND